MLVPQHFMMWSFLIIFAHLLYGCWIVSVESQTQGEPACMVAFAELKVASYLLTESIFMLAQCLSWCL